MTTTTEHTPAIFSGWLQKKGEVGTGAWKKRWFAIRNSELQYFVDPSQANLKGRVALSAIKTVAPANEKGSNYFNIEIEGTCFESTHLTFVIAGRIYQLKAETEEQVGQWIKHLTEGISLALQANKSAEQEIVSESANRYASKSH